MLVVNVRWDYLRQPVDVCRSNTFNVRQPSSLLPISFLFLHRLRLATLSHKPLNLKSNLIAAKVSWKRNCCFTKTRSIKHAVAWKLQKCLKIITGAEKREWRGAAPHRGLYQLIDSRRIMGCFLLPLFIMAATWLLHSQLKYNINWLKQSALGDWVFSGQLN